MAHSPVAHDKGTRFTNYSSIHSADAFVGDYQVMFTPGSTSPQIAKPTKKSTRFGRAVSSTKPQQNISQSYILPSNLPNTSQIMPDHGQLPNIQVHYNIPADEKQIVASLRSLQRDLNEAMQTINELTKERDNALYELRLLRAVSKHPSSPPKRQQGKNIEEQLFDLSSPIQDSPNRHVSQRVSNKEIHRQRQTASSDEARVLSPLPINEVLGRHNENKAAEKKTRQPSKQYKKPVVEDTEQSFMDENPTAASNTSRRRRRTSVDENMTSAYILPDITVEQPPRNSAKVSKAAQKVLHNLEPEHVAECDVCHRLTTKSKPATQTSQHHKQSQAAVRITDFAKELTQQQPDYTAALAGFVDESLLADPTTRPKMSPAYALARVRILMDAQFKKAKERHRLAWEKYDSIEAPLSSKKHAEVGKEMRHWAEKMEECRVHLDYLRDVEEGMGNDA